MRQIYWVAVGSWLLSSACGRLGTGDFMGDGDSAAIGDGDGDSGDGDLGDGDLGDGDLGDGDLGDGDLGDGDLGDGDFGDGDGDGDFGGAPGDGDATGGLGGVVLGDGDGDIDPPDPGYPICTIITPEDGSSTPFHGEFVPLSSEDPANQEFSGITFRALASDREDGVLKGESIVWLIEGGGVSGGDKVLGFGNELTVDALPPGENKIVCQAIDSANNDGFDAITLKVKSPMVYIYHPGALDGPRPAGEEIEFVAAGYDYEDGTLNSDTFVWESDLDGTLGQGNGAYSLSPGTHTVSVSAWDSDENIASASVVVTTVLVETLPPVMN